jgi:hypothetical protein
MKTFLAGMFVLLIFGAAMAGAGTEGPTGHQGPAGRAGTAGPPGPKGERGPRGKAGKNAPAQTNVSTGSSGGSSTTSGSSTIEDGTWEVGADISAGTYRAPGGDSCYWEILKGPPSGDALGNIVENDAASSNVIVTLSDGQWFNTDGCGTWSGR